MAYAWRSMVVVVVVLMVANGIQSESDELGKDKQECATQLSGLATCLPFVSGQSKAPTSDCCTGLNQVLKDSPRCLCLLVKHRNDPSLSLHINSTLALSLPHLCHAPASADVSHCPALLKLAPDSPDAKVFTDFAKAAAPASPTTTTTSPTSTGAGKSSGSVSNGGDKRAYHGLVITASLHILLVAAPLLPFST